MDLLPLKSFIQEKEVDGKMHYFDRIRKKFVVAQPEELVRQLIIIYLSNRLKYPASRIAVERKITINGMPKRFDAVVFDQEGHPFLLIECKSFKLDLEAQSLEQIGLYNREIKAPYLLMTNGRQHFIWHYDATSDRFAELEEIPSYQ